MKYTPSAKSNEQYENALCSLLHFIYFLVVCCKTANYRFCSLQ